MKTTHIVIICLLALSTVGIASAYPQITVVSSTPTYSNIRTPTNNYVVYNPYTASRNYNRDDYDDAYDEGYDDGYDEGYDDGYDDGRDNRRTNSRNSLVNQDRYSNCRPRDCPYQWFSDEPLYNTNYDYNSYAYTYPRYYVMPTYSSRSFNNGWY